MKKVQIGVRVSQEDAEFISKLQIDGANTPSDKLRAIIEVARRKAESSQDFGVSFRTMKAELSPIVEHLKQFEHEQNVRSGVLERILEWMPEFYAYVMTSFPVDDRKSIPEYEKEVTAKIFLVFESLLQLELSSRQQSYGETVLQEHIKPLARLIEIIDHVEGNR